MAVSHCSSLTPALRRATINLCGLQHRQSPSCYLYCKPPENSFTRLSSGEALHGSQPEYLYRTSSRGLVGARLQPLARQSAQATGAPNSALGKLTTQCTGIKTMHTSACVLSPQGKPHITSRRGQLSSLEDAKQYVTSLSAVQRSTLEQALQETRPDVDETMDVVEGARPSTHQLKLLCYQSALPFIGFGFLDNVIMITVGEYIDWTLGLTLGISTMAAAGLGNMISDLAGLGLADQVEAFCLRLGIPNPKLSSAQLKHNSSRWTILLGRCVGIVIGCTIGMAPLFWISDPHKTNNDCTHDHTDK